MNTTLNGKITNIQLRKFHKHNSDKILFKKIRYSYKIPCQTISRCKATECSYRYKTEHWKPLTNLVRHLGEVIKGSIICTQVI